MERVGADGSLWGCGMIVYLATNTVNGMQYVGLTTMCLGRRKTYHFDASKKGRGGENTIAFAIREYGKQRFLFEKIDTAKTVGELQKKECFWIEKLNTMSPNGYNVRGGGTLGMCKWSMQPIEAFGVKYPSIKSFYEAFPNVSYPTLSRRIKNGWPPEDACTKPLQRMKTGKKYPQLLSAAKKTGINYSTLVSRYERGKKGKELTLPLVNAAKKIEINGVVFSSYREAGRFHNIHHSSFA